MSRATEKSLRLSRPRCPRCGEAAGRIDWLAVSNLIRVPAATVSGMLFYPVVRMWMRCGVCGESFRSLGMG